ncbi:putative alcohol dehydrogenase [Rhizodiscina lignyota]|uniref:Alcohol dehydrogenase n=1 Tax=Rhizodiscina lignyota TaxID=1504668 RepID=A0A9P4IF44_9PEZI|nr:putative alcohol dehydrogenase [Rhizodiscina lignyota]
MGRLENKVAIVTGAASGFGANIAQAIVREGGKVIAADIDIEGGQNITEQLNKSSPDSAAFVDFDCTKKVAWEVGLQTAIDKWGKLDIVCSNAGVSYRRKPTAEVTEDEFDRVMGVNVKALYQAVVVIVPYFEKMKRGVFCSTSSVAGGRVRPGQGIYGCSKGAVNNLIQALAAKYGPSGIRFNAVAPLRAPTKIVGVIQGEGWKDSKEEWEKFGKTVPLQRVTTMEDISNAVVYLISEEAAFVTGVILPVDGGRLAV